MVGDEGGGEEVGGGGWIVEGEEAGGYFRGVGDEDRVLLFEEICRMDKAGVACFGHSLFAEDAEEDSAAGGGDAEEFQSGAAHGAAWVDFDNWLQAKFPCGIRIEKGVGAQTSAKPCSSEKFTQGGGDGFGIQLF